MTAHSNASARLLFNALGIFFSVIPVAVSIFSYFPLWIAREDASVLSGISLLLTLLALLPLARYLRSILRTASAPLMWLAVFIAFMLLSRIANEVAVISFVGFIGNLIGALFLKLARVRDDGRA